jgi:glycosyltransferase involved in cell wall biosynthesis
MKILYITSDYLAVGGISQHIENLTCFIAKNHKVSIIYLNQMHKNGIVTDEYNRKIYFISHPGRQLKRFLDYPSGEVKRIIAAEAADIIHVHTLFDAFKLKDYDVPMIFTNHSSSYLKMYQRFFLRHFILKHVLKKFKLVIAPSTELLEKTLHNNRIMIPNAVDTDRFNLVKRKHIKKSAVLKKFNIASDQIIFLSTRRLFDKNGILDFLKNNISYFKSGKAVYLIVGSGEQFLDIEKIKLENQLEHVYLLGSIENQYLDELYYIADCCIIPSKMEAISISALESMAAGTVVIANKVGGLAELINDGITGIFLKNLSLEETLTNVSDDSLFSKIRNNAFKMVKNNYSWDIISNKTIEIYESLISK